MPHRKASLIPLFAIALAASLAIVAATSTFGIGVSAESETYIAAARNFAAGRGLTVPARLGDLTPLTEHAPLYALVLGLAERWGGDAVAAARWVAAACFGALALAAGLALRLLSKRPWLPTAGAALVACSVVMLNINLLALSESLFLVATLIALLLLALHLESGDVCLLAAAATASAVALMTRYAGLALVVAGGVAILRYARAPRRRVSAAAFVAVSCAPLLLWAAYTAAQAGNPVHREFAFHLFSASDASAAVRTISTWLLPAAIPLPARLLALAAACIWLVEVLRRSHLGIPCRLLLEFALSYALLIVAAKSLFDNAIPLDDRILSPLYVPLLIAAALGLDAAPPGFFRRRWLVAVPGILLVVMAGGLNLARVAPSLSAMRRRGREYTGIAWRQSAVAGWLRSMDPATPVYSNADSAVRFLRRGFSGGLPGKADMRSGRANPSYRDELEHLRLRLEHDRAVIIYFTDLSTRFTPDVPELIGSFGVVTVARGENWVGLQLPTQTASRYLEPVN